MVARELSAVRPAFDFRSGIPSAQHFPYATWRGLLSRQVRLSAVPTSAYAGPAGVRALRAAIARHVAVSRGVRAAAEDVFVTNGAQQALGPARSSSRTTTTASSDTPGAR